MVLSRKRIRRIEAELRPEERFRLAKAQRLTRRCMLSNPGWSLGLGFEKVADLIDGIEDILVPVAKIDDILLVLTWLDGRHSLVVRIEASRARL